MATILLPIDRIMTRRTTKIVLRSCGLLCTVVGLLSSTGLAAPSSSDPRTLITECQEGDHQYQGTDSADKPCVSQRAFHAAEALRDHRREEEKEGLRWHSIEPDEQDLRLWYYPGAPRPLWGY